MNKSMFHTQPLLIRFSNSPVLSVGNLNEKLIFGDPEILALQRTVDSGNMKSVAASLEELYSIIKSPHSRFKGAAEAGVTPRID